MIWWRFNYENRSNRTRRNDSEAIFRGRKGSRIRREKNFILVIPLSGEDPILRFGKNPVSDEITDASVNHDEYIYGK